MPGAAVGSKDAVSKEGGPLFVEVLSFAYESINVSIQLTCCSKDRTE